MKYTIAYWGYSPESNGLSYVVRLDSVSATDEGCEAFAEMLRNALGPRENASVKYMKEYSIDAHAASYDVLFHDGASKVGHAVSVCRKLLSVAVKAAYKRFQKRNERMNGKATWDIHLDSKCPKCRAYIDLMDDDSNLDLSGINIGEADTASTRDVDAECPKCNHRFKVDFES